MKIDIDRLTLENAEKYKKEIESAGVQEKYIFNLKDNAFIDSTGIGLLIQLAIKERKKVVLVNMSEQQKVVFKLTGLLNKFEYKEKEGEPGT